MTPHDLAPKVGHGEWLLCHATQRAPYGARPVAVLGHHPGNSHAAWRSRAGPMLDACGGESIDPVLQAPPGSSVAVKRKQPLSTLLGAPLPSDRCQQRSRRSGQRLSKVRYQSARSFRWAQRPTGISLYRSFSLDASSRNALGPVANTGRGAEGELSGRPSG